MSILKINILKYKCIIINDEHGSTYVNISIHTIKLLILIILYVNIYIYDIYIYNIIYFKNSIDI